MNRMALLATAVVGVRVTVATLHGHAHAALGVPLAPWQRAFVVVIVYLVPLVCLALYWTRLQRAAAVLLTPAMLAGLAFGVYFHFLDAGPSNPDHVTNLPGDGGHPARLPFVTTAVLLVPAEAAGAAFGVWSWLTLRGRS